MDRTTLETLEYPAVLNEVSSFAMTSLGRESVLALRPSGDIASIVEAFASYTEVADIIKVQGTLPIGGVEDIRPLFARVEPEGAYLFPEDLLVIKSNIASARNLRTFVTAQFRRDYPRTAGRVDALSDQEPLYSELDRVVNEKGEIKDEASSALYYIRKEIRESKDRARNILEELSTDRNFRDYLQEDYVTIRDDRYVLSIKTGMHMNVDGVIHGRSGSGATYFIEPFRIIELNNKIAVLKKEERAEEIEILKAVTALIAGEKERLLSDLDIIREIDHTQAKALYGRASGAIVPVVKESGEVKLLNARHPLLVAREKNGSAQVIPIDVRIPDSTSVLVISGANTGGKTVALKTLGLLTLMVLSSIPIPVDEGSEAVVFPALFSDIGDRQDIIASLSTFSAHIKRIREFLDLAGPGSLILIDEIGAGTDPAEGSAFALAALETFREIGATTAVTTHLNLLKAHAQTDSRYLNASVEFDEKTLKPLYRLRYGVPGPSLGLSIAQSLGIPAALIEKARTFIKEEEGAFIESVRLLEEEKEEVRKLKEKLFRLETQRNEAVHKLKAERALLIEKMKSRVEAAIREGKEEIRAVIEKLREERALNAASASARVEEAGTRVIEKLTPRTYPAKAYTPEVGHKVMIVGSNTRGEVMKIDADCRKAEVMVGKIKVWVGWDKLTRRGGNEPSRRPQGFARAADMEVASSVNIIGLRVEEAMPAVTKLVDGAHASGLSTVEIIHGVGTGRLAKAVEEFLKASPVVKAYRHGDPARGGAGVTVVELK